MEGTLKNSTKMLFGKYHFEGSGIDGSIILINVLEKVGCEYVHWLTMG
jgi:hypothetical protein